MKWRAEDTVPARGEEETGRGQKEAKREGKRIISCRRVKVLLRKKVKLGHTLLLCQIQMKFSLVLLPSLLLVKKLNGKFFQQCSMQTASESL